MDAMAQTLQAFSFLPENFISDTLNLFRASEIPLEPTSVQLYFRALTGSTAIISVIEILARVFAPLLE